MRYKYLLERSRGFTLIELLIAAAVFAFAITGILQMFISATFLDRVNRNKNIARNHAETVMEKIMESLKSETVDHLQAQISAGNWSWNYSTIGDNLGCASPYAYPCVLDNESITTSYNASTSDPLGINVTVSWENRAQTNMSSLCLETLVSQR
jgi:prepilin-type N-terminal cleavage/methylation domain-containing protein